MSFVFARYAAIFCGVAFLLAVCADSVKFFALLLIRGSFMFAATRRGWLFLFALWWLISFVVALPLARRFSGLPHPFL
jgi:hypothetical protein